jgi:hypothetical protein
MLDRDKIIQEAIDRCLEEMYQKSQPKASYYDYIAKAKRGEIGKDELVFERHYLNQKQFDYIREKYIKAYRLQNEWKSDIDFLLDNLRDGGYRTVYKPLIEGGEPCRTSEQMSPIEDIIGKENKEKLFKYIETLRDFYRFDREEDKFNFNVCLGASPTSNADKVREYWKSQGIDIEIDETELTEDEYWEIDEYGHLLRDEEEE